MFTSLIVQIRRNEKGFEIGKPAWFTSLIVQIRLLKAFLFQVCLAQFTSLIVQIRHNTKGNCLLNVVMFTSLIVQIRLYIPTRLSLTR